MAARGATIRGMQACRTGDAVRLFLREEHAAVAWAKAVDRALVDPTPEHSGQFDSRLEGLLPLKRVYLPTRSTPETEPHAPGDPQRA